MKKMKYYLQKIKLQLKELYKNYKEESMIYKQFEEPAQAWETKLGWAAFLTLVVLIILDICLVNIPYKSGILAFVFSWLFILYHVQAKRDFRTVKKYYDFKKATLSQKRTVFTSSAVAIKIVKPVFVYCAKCSAVGLTLNFAYGEIFGFSPLNEIGRSLAGVQTWEQALYHTTHPMQYMNSPDSPIVQDLKKEHAKEVGALKEQINKIIEKNQNRK